MSRLFATFTAILIAKLQWVYVNVVESPTVGMIVFSRMFVLRFNPKTLAVGMSP